MDLLDEVVLALHIHQRDGASTKTGTGESGPMAGIVIPRQLGKKIELDTRDLIKIPQAAV